MSTKSGPPREKTKQTRKQYTNVKQKNTTIFKQREQKSIPYNTKSYSPRMTDLLPSNFSDIADISSKNAVSKMKQSSRLVPTRATFNSTSNRNNQNVKVRDDSIKETDQSNKKVDNTTCQGIVGKPKKKVV